MLRKLFDDTEKKAPENWNTVDRQINEIFDSRGSRNPHIYGNDQNLN